MKRNLQDIQADFYRSDDFKEPTRTRRLVRLMDELEADYGTLRMSRVYTKEEAQKPENILYMAISAARK